MHILVTGGAGFIGSNFVRHALSRAKDARVTNLDALTYAGNLENLSDLEIEQRYRFVRGDVSDRALVDRLLAGNGDASPVDAIVHFAAESHVDRSILGPDAFVQSNVVGTYTLLESVRAARAYGAPRPSRFVLVSTDEVYGSLGPAGQFTEESPLRPNSPYAATKAAADLLARAAFTTFGLPVLITRCCNNYGPYQFPEKVLPLFITNALEGKPLPLYGDGRNVRDWIHVEDHCEALWLVLERGLPGEVYNIGARCERPNDALARAIVSLLGLPESRIERVTDRPGHDRRYAIDPSKAERELGFRAAHPAIEEALPGLIEWYRDHRSWWERIKSGAYREYYRRNYEERGHP